MLEQITVNCVENGIDFDEFHYEINSKDGILTFIFKDPNKGTLIANANYPSYLNKQVVSNTIQSTAEILGFSCSAFLGEGSNNV